MGLKNTHQLEKRRKFILNKVDELLKTGVCDTVTECYLYISDNLLFCHVDTIYRSVRGYKSNK